MSSEELSEFFAAMEIVRQANMAWPEAARGFIEQDGTDEDELADLCPSVTLH